jgi:hypothetical protein
MDLHVYDYLQLHTPSSLTTQHSQTNDCAGDQLLCRRCQQPHVQHRNPQTLCDKINDRAAEIEQGGLQKGVPEQLRDGVIATTVSPPSPKAHGFNTSCHTNPEQRLQAGTSTTHSPPYVCIIKNSSSLHRKPCRDAHNCTPTAQQKCTVSSSPSAHHTLNQLSVPQAQEWRT